MQLERQYAVTVVVGLAAFAVCLALGVHGVVSVAAGLVYAGGAYYATRHPTLLWGSGGQSWESGALAGVSTFAFTALVGADESVGVVVLAFGLTYFGFVTGVAYARAAS